MAMELNRRRVLQIGLLGGVALAAAGTLSWVRFGYHLQPGERPVALSPKEWCVVRAMVEALLPADGDLPAGIDLGIVQRIDEEVWSAPPGVTKDLKAALQLMEHAPPALGFAGRFSSLSPEARRACFDRMLRSRWGLLVQTAVAYKQMAHLFYYGHPATWGATGYDGPWIGQEKPPPSALAYRGALEAAYPGGWG
ncbi:MAG: hypothetical protein JRJ84_02255 [Deltaproteobacteria bacterium]|nr:hypothetical protein [Deltaproteobacteria bacterium]